MVDLARFPYQEHPRNLALVQALAADLGLDPEVALVEMADHILADIGGLRAYGPFPIAARRLRFANGMSANERASALGNWRRMGFDTHLADAEPGRWMVGLVNNRANRGARSLTFAEAIVEDFGAHRFVLVGSGLSALRKAIDAALDRRLERLRPAELGELLAKLKVGQASAPAAQAELAAWLEGLGMAAQTAESIISDGALVAALREALVPAGETSLAGARAAVETSAALARLRELLTTLPDLSDALIHFASDSWARRRAGAAILARSGDGDDLDVARRLLGELFTESLLVPPDPEGSADDLLEFMVRVCPPGVLVDVMGLQNIKGPGLACVYRLAAAERLERELAGLAATDVDAREAAVRRLQEIDGVGRHALLAAAEVVARAAEAQAAEAPRLTALAERLRARAALAGGLAGPVSAFPSAPASGASVLRRVLAWGRRSVDHVPSVGRRRNADSIFH